MTFEPDVVVVAPGGRVQLVAEAKLALGDRKAAVEQLKQYMVGMRCPVGLLVTRETLSLFRDRYTDHSEESIESIGDFSIASLPSLSKARSEADLARNVRDWLESLADPSARHRLPSDLREKVEDCVLPALEGGEVRLAGPRRRHPTTI